MRQNTHKILSSARWRRPDTRPAVFQYCGNTIVDEAPIEGSRNSPDRGESGQGRRDSARQLDLSPREEELQFDAFDLELLAQANGPSQRNQLGPFSGDSVPYPPLQTINDIQVSRFFQSSSATPRRALESSISEADMTFPSSPLARIQNQRAAGTRRFGMRAGPSSHQIMSSELNESPSHTSPTLSAAASHDQMGNPFQDSIPMSIRGIVLVSAHELPDNYRSLFPFLVFNAVQSKCFHPVYKEDDNIVLSAPTGSGKTVIMELAICRLLNRLKDERFKVVYQAPTKSLCAERFRDWNRKFHSLGLQCAELTGDTDHSQLRSVQSSQIIITTPEKWDSMTRKWKDHARLMQLVKLFLIDEVHILKEARGATLETVVSRMKSIGSNVRFVALSATIPNSEDVATWLGKDATNQHVPARREHFGEDFRPVRLQKFVYGYQSHGNDFAFDKMCNSKLPDVIAMHSRRKPIMIFCCTRNSSMTTAKELAKLWSTSNPPARHWKGSSKGLEVLNADLKITIAAGVAFHHAGLDPADRHTVETGFLQGHISIICCTSTLAVGVNLPCHLVVIKNTVGWQDGGCKEYSDLEVMQMLGRAGRPQFDDSATAVILTRKERVSHYEKLVSGSESLESCLHLNLIDHLNAEIGLGNVTDIESAIKWLAGTFLFVRLRRNPIHYDLREGADRDDEDEMLRQICEKDIKLLQECGLVTTGCLRATQFGDAMARYYVRFETMKGLLSLERHATAFQILSVIAQADEFREVRLKAGEKSLYKEINRASSIKFPVKVDIALPAHKISLLIQAELGAVDFPDGEQFQKHKFAFQQDKGIVFSHVSRLIRCIIDCQIALEDSIAARNALELARSFGAKVWDTSPLQMKQIDQIGIVAVRKLAAAGIASIEELGQLEAHRIEMILSKNPPFGLRLLGRLADFPKLRVSTKIVKKEVKAGQSVKVFFKAELGFMNEKCPTFFQRWPVYVCFLAERSDGWIVDFRRLSASKLNNSLEIPLSVEVKRADQYVTCYAMCDEIAGTLKSADLKANLPPSLFPAQAHENPKAKLSQRHEMNTSRPRSIDSSKVKSSNSYDLDILDSDDQLFDDFMGENLAALSDESLNVDKPWIEKDSTAPEAPACQPPKKGSKESKMPDNSDEKTNVERPTRLENGRWACNHRCKDKTTCKHFCCRDGLDKPPKGGKTNVSEVDPRSSGLSQLTLPASLTKKEGQTPRTEGRSARKDVGKTLRNDAGQGIILKKDCSSTKTGADVYSIRSSSEYGDDSFDDYPSPSKLMLGSMSEVDDTFLSDEVWMTSLSTFTSDTQPDEHSVPRTVDRDGERHREVLDKDMMEETSRHTVLSSGDKEAPTPAETCLVGAYHGVKRKSSDTRALGKDRKRPKECQPGRRASAQRMTPVPDPRTGDWDVPETPSLSLEPISLESSTEWHGIDPSLLNEFKDIIDFF
ncbi:P-loop containing nucleoside triphosphate hydrolase protein [Aspergillus taichungensis]|uniref:DNA 3'-5' helicase n=1 Tax=Aspergillus taichungensis TaxID=482145 RepID=A0A2J5I479_9EURO|nr:P-loop containing nucleoside triphosphate hydrolase protein [Aspergillus taichungensis]